MNSEREMSRLETIMKLLYELLYMVPLCAIEGSVALLYLSDKVPFMPKEIWGFAVAFLGLAVLLSIRHLKNRFRFLIPLTLLVLGVGIVWIQPPEERWEFVLHYSFIFWMFGVALLAFLSGLIVAGRKWMERITAIGLSVGIIVSMVLKMDLKKFFVAFVLFFVMLVVTEEVQRHWNKEGDTHAGRHLVSVALFLAVQMVLVYVMPVSNKPYEWSHVKALWSRVMDGFQFANRFFYSGEEQLGAVIGLSEESEFFASLRKDNKKIMKLTCAKDSGDVIYLRANTFDHFDGRGWTYEEKEETPYDEDAYDLMLTWCALHSYEPDNYMDFMYKTSLELTYDQVHTQFIFAPMKSMLPGNLDREGKITWNKGAYRSENLCGYGTKISYKYFRLNRQHDLFKNFLMEAPAALPDPVMWERAVVNYLSETEGILASTDGRFPYSELEAYHASIYEDLEVVPLSEEVGAYMEELLEGADTDYEKLERIEQMLKSMTYTVHPGVLSKDVQTPSDFLDEMLLHTQQGYCSHFATAFVLLARSQGIPARYVQGYYVPKNKDTTVEITSDMAHAWAEAYIDGVGWISFEPTPGKSAGKAWFVPDRAALADPSKSQNPYENEEKEVLLPEVVEKEEEPVKPIEIGKYLGIFGAWIFLCILLFAGNRYLERRRFKKLSEDKRFMVMCDRNKTVLKWMGYEVQRGESLEEFRIRVSKELPSDCVSFLERLEEVYYGEFPIDSKMYQEAQESNRHLWEQLKERKGKRYILYLLSGKNA